VANQLEKTKTKKPAAEPQTQQAHPEPNLSHSIELNLVDE
jgi:hypothetical protein